MIRAVPGYGEDGMKKRGHGWWIVIFLITLFLTYIRIVTVG